MFIQPCYTILGDNMKLNRLLEITTILLNKKTVTAAELAERFGVSIRTIYRDIDVLSASGVPVYATQGAKGGISILEDYTVNRTALSNSERDSIVFALQTLHSIQYPDIDAVLEKLGNFFTKTATDWISVDFSPWGSNPNAFHRFTDIKNAIMQSRVVEIEYINSGNIVSTRKIEPLRLVFKYQAWYLWAYCLQKQEYRIFRISRIKKIKLTEQSFDRSRAYAVTDQHTSSEGNKPTVHLVLLFTPEAYYRLCDDFDENQIKDNNDGSYLLEMDVPEDEWVYGYILSYGTNVKVIEPEHIRNGIRERSQRITEFYLK